jgi:hypothetical protein
MIEAARTYFEAGYTTTPLRRGDDGKPKVPITLGWQHTPYEWEAIEAQAWDEAAGIGIVLGAQSSNLAVIDLDDIELADAVQALLRAGTVEHHWVETGRMHGHLYLLEETCSRPSTFRIQWHEKTIRIELKAQGQQVAAPPTPGYRSVWADTPAQSSRPLNEAWNAIASRLGILEQPASQSGSANFPRPWAENVPAGDRNMTLYVEAHKLREAGLSLQQAVDLLTARVRSSYAASEFGDREVQATVKNAYKKGVRKVHVGWME